MSLPRLFVAAWPPAEVLDLLETLPRPSDPGVRWTRRDQWHVTLRFLGAADPDAATAALASVDAVAVEAVLGPLTARLGRSVVVVPVGGLAEVAAAVAAATADVGEPPDPRPFAGHLTLARLRQRPACGVTGTRCSARFPVRELHLVRSHLHHEGARYENLAVVPLRPAPAQGPGAQDPGAQDPGAQDPGAQDPGAQDSGAGSSRSDAEFMQ